MKNTFRSLVLIGAALTLAACTCPKKHTGDDSWAYDHERTAGTGTAVYEGKCHEGEEITNYAVIEERTAGSSGDEVFQSSIRK
jgi:hypothetical protein